jgi:hypothetical protein
VSQAAASAVAARDRILASAYELFAHNGIRAVGIDEGQFAHSWHLLMKGSIVAAGEGDADAAKRA